MEEVLDGRLEQTQDFDSISYFNLCNLLRIHQVNNSIGLTQTVIFS